MLTFFSYASFNQVLGLGNKGEQRMLSEKDEPELQKQILNKAFCMSSKINGFDIFLDKSG